MRLFAVAALAAVLTACGAATPPPAPTPPKAAIVALAHPPAALAPKPDVVTLDHPHWSITVPATVGWTVEENNEEGAKIVRAKDPEHGVLPMLIEVSVNEGVTDTQQWLMMSSVLLIGAAQQNGTVTGVKRGLLNYGGYLASLTQVSTEEHVFLGQLALRDAATNQGFAIICVAPMTGEDGKLAATITKTFKLKDAPTEALPTDDDSDDSSPDGGTPPAKP
jgi:hypothetical protein